MIIAKSISKSFGTTKAVDNVSLEVGKGQLYGLLGPNGSGKSTMIKMLTGQISPSSGHASVEGIDTQRDPIEVRSKVGIIPEQENPPSFLTAGEYLDFVAKARKLEQYDTDKWFTLLDFKDQKDILCKDLSRGTRQKLMIAQAFMHNPAVAFIDEPLINLDPISQNTIKSYIVDFVKKGGTVFFSTHVLEIAQEICTHIGILYKGKLHFSGKRPKGDLNTFFLKQVKHAGSD
ncbi:ABC transporter ATP-binding protein [Candidatus Woesearchaeota archaeon]|nr:ABC transporter ATP-binding protein [Candidatus Woesearchaeota archaeon]